MKKLAFFGMMAAFVMTMGSCGGGAQQPQQVVEEEPDSVDPTEKNLTDFIVAWGDTYV